MLQADTLQFLRDIKENNHKAWFEEQKDRYNQVRADYHQLAEALIAAMIPYDQTLGGLTARDTTYRFYRDVRFSKDKTPYKTQLGIVLQAGGKKSPFCAYYLHIEPGQSYAGGGLWMPESEVLNKARKEIHYFFDEFKSIVESPTFLKTFQGLDIIEGQKLSRPPKGYDADNPAQEYLKFKSFIASKSISDQMMTDPTLVEEVIRIFRDLKPMVEFFNRGILSDEYGGI